jgi:hypothetical protein
MYCAGVPLSAAVTWRNPHLKPSGMQLNFLEIGPESTGIAPKHM